jgi:hypothetical protein
MDTRVHIEGLDGPDNTHNHNHFNSRSVHSDELDSMMAVEVVPRILSFEGLQGLHKTLQGMVKAMMSLRRDIVHTQQQMQSAEVNMRVAKLESKVDVVSASLAQHPAEGGRFVTTDFLMDFKDHQRYQIDMIKAAQSTNVAQMVSSADMLKDRMDTLAGDDGPIPTWIAKQLSDGLRGVNIQLDKLSQENRDLRSDLAEHKRQLEEVKDLQVKTNAALQALSSQQHLREEVVVLQERIQLVEDRVEDNEKGYVEIRQHQTRHESTYEEQLLKDRDHREVVAADSKARSKHYEKMIIDLQAEVDETNRQLGDVLQRTVNNTKDIRLMGTHIDESEDSARDRLSKQLSRVEERLSATANTLAESDERTRDSLSDLSQWRIMADVRLGGTKEHFLALGNEIADVKSELSAVLTAQGRVEMHAKSIADAGAEREFLREQIASLVSAQQQLPDLLDASLEEMEGSIRQYVKSKTDAVGVGFQQHIEQRLAAASEGICGLLGVFGFDVGNTRGLFGDACRDVLLTTPEGTQSSASALLLSNNSGPSLSKVRPGYANTTMEAWLRKALLSIVNKSSGGGSEEDDLELSKLRALLVFLLSPTSLQKDIGGCNANEATSRSRIATSEASEWEGLARKAAEERFVVNNRDAMYKANKMGGWSHRTCQEYLVGHQHISSIGIEVAEISCARGSSGGSRINGPQLPAVYDGMVVITKVDVGQPGYTSGLQEDDILVAVNNKEISGKTSLLSALHVSSNNFVHESSLPWIRLIVRRGFEGALISIRLTHPH